MNRLRREVRRVGPGLLVAVAVMLALVASLAWVAFHGQSTTDQAISQRNATGQRAADLATQVRQACAAGGKAADRLHQQGLCGQAKKIQKDPVVGPAGPPGQRGPQGPPPTQIQVRQAVSAYCRTNGCQGPRGAEGDAPSKADVAAAVSAYCNANGECKGPQGGKGDRGPGPSSGQVADAVASYCAAHGGCAGPQGPKGDKGDTGGKGSTGDRGPAGETGSDGKPGKPPASFSFTDQLGVTYTCTPDGPAGPGDQPHYSCTPQEGP